jgi:hypothetical protein
MPGNHGYSNSGENTEAYWVLLAQDNHFSLLGVAGSRQPFFTHVAEPNTESAMRERRRLRRSRMQDLQEGLEFAAKVKLSPLLRSAKRSLILESTF